MCIDASGEHPDHERKLPRNGNLHKANICGVSFTLNHFHSMEFLEDILEAFDQITYINRAKAAKPI